MPETQPNPSPLAQGKKLDPPPLDQFPAQHVDRLASSYAIAHYAVLRYSTRDDLAFQRAQRISTSARSRGDENGSPVSRGNRTSFIISSPALRSSGMDSLTRLLHALPQELIDQIYNEVFTAPPRRVHIATAYTLPHLLTVTSASRTQYAKSYYQNTLFIVDNDLDLHAWLRRLAGCGHLGLLKQVHFRNRSLLDPGVSRLQGPLDRSHLYRSIAARQHGSHLLARLRRNLSADDGLELAPGVLRLEQHFVDDFRAEDVVVVC